MKTYLFDRIFLILLLLGFVIMQSCSYSGAREVSYPQFDLPEKILEYHGEEVVDKFYWMEENDSARNEWLNVQQALDNSFFDKETVGEIKQVVEDITTITTYRGPVMGTNAIAYLKYGEKAPSIVFQELGGKPSLLMTPPSDTIWVVPVSQSRNDQYLAVLEGDPGSRWQLMKVVDVQTGKMLNESIKGIIWSAAPAWDKNSEGFYYHRFDSPKDEMTATLANGRVLYHKIGTPVSEDLLMYKSDPDTNQEIGGVTITADGDYLLLTVTTSSFSKNGVLVKPLRGKNSTWKWLFPPEEAVFTFVGNKQNKFWFLTNAEAGNNKLIEVDIEASKRSEWKEIISERKDELLSSVSYSQGSFIATYRKDVANHFRIVNDSGSVIKRVELPSIGGSLGPLLTDGDGDKMIFTYSSISHPGFIYTIDKNSGQIDVLAGEQGDEFRGKLKVEQVFFESTDGTSVPMFLVYKSGTTLKDKIVYMPVYGAYGLTLTPSSTNPNQLLVPKLGGIVAIPGVRGGGEYGISWYEAGKGINKQNTIDDILAACRFLIDNGYTSEGKIVLQGGSAGSTPVGAAANQSPNLFGAVIMKWPILDMIRFKDFTSGHRWVAEYGSPEVKEEFTALKSYSPYHNVRPNTCFPSTLIVAAGLDNIAHPVHAFKQLAAMQSSQACANPVLMHYMPNDSHFSNSVDNMNEVLAHEISFYFEVLGIDPSVVITNK